MAGPKNVICVIVENKTSNSFGDFTSEADFTKKKKCRPTNYSKYGMYKNPMKMTDPVVFFLIIFF